mmetsp:Transcript_44520/g.123249  ORF Transcript_44520/g.123249 Transcript_44520/m.123249 type:complete len:309 (+) Transcript_44520:1660-2586(+)
MPRTCISRAHRAKLVFDDEERRSSGCSSVDNPSGRGGASVASSSSASSWGGACGAEDANSLHMASSNSECPTSPSSKHWRNHDISAMKPIWRRSRLMKTRASRTCSASCRCANIKSCKVSSLRRASASPPSAGRGLPLPTCASSTADANSGEICPKCSSICASNCANVSSSGRIDPNFVDTWLNNVNMAPAAPTWQPVHTLKSAFALSLKAFTVPICERSCFSTLSKPFIFSCSIFPVPPSSAVNACIVNLMSCLCSNSCKRRCCSIRTNSAARRASTLNFAWSSACRSESRRFSSQLVAMRACTSWI